MYTPDTDFSGIDQFSYQVDDGALDGNIAIVSIAVGGVFGGRTKIARNGISRKGAKARRTRALLPDFRAFAPLREKSQHPVRRPPPSLPDRQ